MSSPTGRLRPWFSPKRVILVLLLVTVVVMLLYAGRMLIASMQSAQRITLDDDHLSLSLSVPAGMGITSVTREGFGDEPQCATVRYRLGTELTLESFASSCEVTDDESSDYDTLSNGYHGEYRTMDDVADPIDVTSLDTPLGPAHVFSQKYGEYTNLSRTWEEPVAIVELSDPADPEFSSLVIRSDREALSRDDVVEILDSLRDVQQ
jgi:hypothetical protein